MTRDEAINIIAADLTHEALTERLNDWNPTDISGKDREAIVDRAFDLSPMPRSRTVVEAYALLAYPERIKRATTDD